jgi:hypothetical protein
MDAKRESFEVLDGTTLLQLGPRYRSPVPGPGGDTVVAQLYQRTMGPSSGRSILLQRADVESLAAWCAQWLDEGWDGTPRACGRRHEDRDGRVWECDQEPGHILAGRWHEGPCTGWRTSDGGRPGRIDWELAAEELRARVG